MGLDFIFIIMNNIEAFIREIEIYQSNHYGYYNRSVLITAYNALPSQVKIYLSPPRKILTNLWRGCDGLSEILAISFTINRKYASFFGLYVIPFGELKSYSALIDTGRLLKLKDKLKIDAEIGDDEGEVIVLNPVWNSNIDLNKYMVS